MSPSASLPLSEWAAYYVIVGSGAAALIGLQFVVIVLIAQVQAPGSRDTVSAFGTPTIIHFGAALLVSAIMSAPWRALSNLSIVLYAIGIIGLLVVVQALLRARRQKTYRPVLEDWLWHTIIPAGAYITIFASGLWIADHGAEALIIVAASTLLLLFVGIHNAWDSVTYIVVERGLRAEGVAQSPPPLPATPKPKLKHRRH